MSSRRPEAVQPSDLSFDTLCSLFDILTNSANSKTKSAANRRKIIDKFIDTCVARAGGQAFCLFRLCIPAVSRLVGTWDAHLSLYIPLDRILKGHEIKSWASSSQVM